MPPSRPHDHFRAYPPPHTCPLPVHIIISEHIHLPIHAHSPSTQSFQSIFNSPSMRTSCPHDHFKAYPPPHPCPLPVHMVISEHIHLPNHAHSPSTSFQSISTSPSMLTSRPLDHFRAYPTPYPCPHPVHMIISEHIHLPIYAHIPST
jgi:hypothetical protein